jgi:hypothetical protein
MTDVTPSPGNGVTRGAGSAMQTVPYLAAPAPPDPGWQPAAPPPLPPHAPTPPPVLRGSSRMRRGLFRLLLLLAVLVAAGGTIYAVTTYQNQSQPGMVVQSYLEAVARGDAPAALSYGDVPSGSQSLLTSAMLQNQNAVARMSGITIVGISQTGRTATVSVRYTLHFASGAGDVPETDKIPTVRVGHTWRLSAVAIPLQLSLDRGAGADRARLDGEAVPTNSQLYFPGALPLKFDTANLQLSSNQAVLFSGPHVATLEVKVSPAGRSAVRTVLAQALTACLAGKFTPLTSCPLPTLPTDEIAVPGTLRGTTTFGLNTNLSLIDADLLPGADGTLRIASHAVVTGTYSKLDFNNLPVTTPLKAATISFTASCTASCSSAAPTDFAWVLQ